MVTRGTYETYTASAPHRMVWGFFIERNLPFAGRLDPCWSEVDRVMGAFPRKRKAVLADGLVGGGNNKRGTLSITTALQLQPQHLCGQGGSDPTPGCRGKAGSPAENHFANGQPLSFGST